MSRTMRTGMQYEHSDRSYSLTTTDETKAKWVHVHHRPKRLTPYMLPDVPYKGKFRPYSCNYNYRRTGPGARTGVNNANRHFKKGVRQAVKKMIRMELSNPQ